MYIGTGNPGPFPGTSQYPVGIEQAGPEPVHGLDRQAQREHRRRLQWYYQLTPHDLYDRDLQDPPILASVGGTPVVIAAGKAGFVIALDAASREAAVEALRRDPQRPRRRRHRTR